MNDCYDSQIDRIREANKIKSAKMYKDFANSIKASRNLLNDMCNATLFQPELSIQSGKIGMLDCEFLLSGIRTLNNIEYCCVHGCFSDAHVLTRKYRDDLFLFLYIISVLAQRKRRFESALNEIALDEMDETKFVLVFEAALNISQDNSGKNQDDRAVDAWFCNAVTGRYTRNIKFENYLETIKTDPDIKQCLTQNDLKSVLDKIARRLNDYTHNNGRRYLENNLLNPKRPTSDDESLSQLTADIHYITGAFFVFIVLMKPSLIMASDYIDYLDCGEEPPEDSQYWVAPFAQEYVDDYIVKLNPDLKTFLKYNNKYGMKIE